MTKDADRKDAYREQIVARTRMVREMRTPRVSREQMARFLGITKSQYKSYEEVTPIPHYLIEQWCLIMGVSISWLITGREAVQEIPSRKIKMTG